VGMRTPFGTLDGSAGDFFQRSSGRRHRAGDEVRALAGFTTGYGSRPRNRHLKENGADPIGPVNRPEFEPRAWLGRRVTPGKAVETRNERVWGKTSAKWPTSRKGERLIPALVHPWTPSCGIQRPTNTILAQCAGPGAARGISRRVRMGRDSAIRKGGSGGGSDPAAEGLLGPRLRGGGRHDRRCRNQLESLIGQADMLWEKAWRSVGEGFGSKAGVLSELRARCSSAVRWPSS